MFPTEEMFTWKCSSDSRERMLRRRRRSPFFHMYKQYVRKQASRPYSTSSSSVHSIWSEECRKYVSEVPCEESVSRDEDARLPALVDRIESKERERDGCLATSRTSHHNPHCHHHHHLYSQ